MSKLTRLWKKLENLERKKSLLEFDIDNIKSEIRYWQAMEDDKTDWSEYEDI